MANITIHLPTFPEGDPADTSMSDVSDQVLLLMDKLARIRTLMRNSGKNPSSQVVSQAYTAMQRANNNLKNVIINLEK